MKKLLILLVLLPTSFLQPVASPEKENNISERIKGMIATILTEHNTCRQASSRDLADLKWDDNLAAFAQAQAEELIKKQPLNLEHSVHDDRAKISGWEEQWIGENLGYGMNSAWKLNTSDDDLMAALQQTIQSWCNEKQYYNQSSNTCQAGKSCGHFTQVAWQETTSVGCGIAVSENGTEYIVVCNYGPGGNIPGVKPYGGTRPGK